MFLLILPGLSFFSRILITFLPLSSSATSKFPDFLIYTSIPSIASLTKASNVGLSICENIS